MLKLDFVVPLFNEQESLRKFHETIEASVLPQRYSRRYIYINDGSSDGTQDVLRELAAKDSRVLVLELSRNFGHQAALSAGLDASDGDVVITMDGDGQHPASLVPEMLRLYEGGCDIVQAQRFDESGPGVFKRFASRCFYRVMRAVGEVDLAEGTSDFRLLSRRALDALRRLPEYHRFLRGMSAWIGFTSAMVPFKPPERMGGKSKYSLRKMVRLAGDGFFSFSLVPLRIGLFLGLAFILTAAAELLYIAYVWIGGHRDQMVPGWPSLILILTVSSAINMILMGILGVYVGMIFREVKRRPVYLVQSKLGDRDSR